MTHSDPFSVSLGRHSAPVIALCALLCIVKVPMSHLAGHVCGCRGNNGMRICTCTCPPACMLRLPVWGGYTDLCFHCSFWTEYFPWMSLPPLLSSSGTSGPWIWLALDGEHSVVCAGQVLCHLVWVWHCSWWPQPEHCGNICWDSWVWMKECSRARNYFPGDLFLFGSILLYWSWVRTHLAVFSAWNPPVMYHPSVFRCYWG